MEQHPNAPKSPVWKWLLIGGGVVLIFACGACIMARMACDSAVNGALDALGPVPVAPGSPSTATPPSNASPFTALASHLHFNSDHREGPGSSLLEGYADEDRGIAIHVFRTETATRVAFLVAERYLGDLGSAERQAMLREVATEFENSFPETDFLVAYRGRLLFGASAIKVGGSAWDLQTGTSISEAPLHAFFTGILPADEASEVTNEPLVIHGETSGNESYEIAVDCLGSFSLLPQARIRLAAPLNGLTIRAHQDSDLSMLSILLRRPDGIHRCVYDSDDQDPVLEGAFPAGAYDVWVGGLGPATSFELTIAGTE